MELFSESICSVDSVEYLNNKKLVYNLTAKRPAVFVGEKMTVEELENILKELEDHATDKIKQLYDRLNFRHPCPIVLDNEINAKNAKTLLDSYVRLEKSLYPLIEEIEKSSTDEYQLNKHFKEVEVLYAQVLDPITETQLKEKRLHIQNSTHFTNEELKAYCDILRQNVANNLSKKIKKLTIILDSYLTRLEYDEEEILIEEIAHNYLTPIIRLDKTLTSGQIQEYLKVIQTLTLLKPNMLLVINDEYLTSEEKDKVSLLEHYCQKKHWQELRINDPELKITRYTYSLDKEYDEAWKASVLQAANANIKEVVEYIREANLSPLEAAACIHEYVSTVRAYNKQKGIEYSKQSSFVGAYDKESGFVCAGYTSLFITCVKELNMPGLSAEKLHVKLYHQKEGILSKIFSKKSKKYEEAHHAQVLVHVDDKKYNKKGDYLDDPTWDSTSSRIEMPTFAYCLLPITVLYEYQKGIIQPAINNNKALSSARGLSQEQRDEKGCIVQRKFPKDKEWVIDKIDQTMMEEIIFTMLQKRYEALDFIQLYNAFVKIIKNSFKKGSNIWGKQCSPIGSPTTMLTQEDLVALFEKNKKVGQFSTVKSVFLTSLPIEIENKEYSQSLPITESIVTSY